MSGFPKRSAKNAFHLSTTRSHRFLVLPWKRTPKITCSLSMAEQTSLGGLCANRVTKRGRFFGFFPALAPRFAGGFFGKLRGACGAVRSNSAVRLLTVCAVPPLLVASSSRVARLYPQENRNRV